MTSQATPAVDPQATPAVKPQATPAVKPVAPAVEPQATPAKPVAPAAAGRDSRRTRTRPWPTGPRWLWAVIGVIAAAVLIVALTGMRPGYDAFGWLVWGRQVLHWNLNTDGAPSWKPLTIVFTLPYALAGGAQMWLWLVTAVGGALAGAVFAARIAYRLTRPRAGREPALVAAGIAALGVLGMSGYAHQVLIANSDPLLVTLCLAAVDSHLCRRPRVTFGLLVLAALGRPEVWVFAGLYAVWLWRAGSAARVLIVLGVVLIPAFWFAVPALTSHSWLISGDLALNQATAIHGNKAIGVIERLRSLWGLPMQLAVLLGVAIAVVRRDRVALALLAASCLWVAVEIAFALHGWSAVPRYMLEPAALLVVLASAGVGWALGYASRARGPLRWVLPAVGAALIVGLVPGARQTVRVAHHEVGTARVAGRRIDRLTAVIGREGGGARIRACGQPVTFVGYQSTVAWEVGLNVGNVGYRPGKSIDGGQPVVLIRPHKDGWQVLPFNLLRPDREDCARLRLDADGR